MKILITGCAGFIGFNFTMYILDKTNIKIFGPNKIASKLEGSKTFTKKLCKKYNIQTSKFDIFENKDSAKKFLTNSTQ